MRQVREERDSLLRRLPLFQMVFTTLLVGVAVTYWFVQVVEGDHYRVLAENNRLQEVPLKAPRGLIFDRRGEMLVENVPSYNLWLEHSRMADLEASLGFAAEILGAPADALEAAAETTRGRGRAGPVLMAEDLSLTEVSRFAAQVLEHPEFEVTVGHRRLYRHGPLTAHVLGYLGEASENELQRADGALRAGDLVGKQGVERAFDGSLRGEDGKRTVIVDSHGRLREEASRLPAEPGAELTLALDLELQQIAARYFDDKVGAAVALDPNTGAIRALVSAPFYNPNSFAQRLDQTAWREMVEAPFQPLQNRAIQNTYSPGSLFKIVIALAGLSEGTIQADDSVHCRGWTRIYNRRFRCWKREGHGWVNLRRAIKESCDVYFYHLGQKLGIATIGEYAQLLGLGRPTGVELAGEKRGLVPSPEWSLKVRKTPWYPGETISVAIGQGPLLVTPLQVASLLATVANGGWRVTPRLSRAEGVPEAQPVTIDAEALEQVRDGLWAVVNEERGTARAARVPGLEVAGKTGTVQVIHQKTWVKSEDLPYKQRDHAWFGSFATGSERQLVVVVFVEHGGRGSVAAAPLAKLLYEAYFRNDLDSRRAS